MTPSEPTSPRAAIVAVAKNEGVYLHEWIAYHRLIGFDEVLVYDNASTDGSGALLEHLAGQGLVTAIPWTVRADVAPQTSGYEDALKRLGADFGWAAFVDLDEFFVLPRHETIGAFLAEHGGEDAIGVNWKNFGSSGHEHYEPEPVIDRFRRCSKRDYGRNRRVKVLAPTAALVRPGVHTPKLRAPARFVDVAGRPIHAGRSVNVRHDVIRLNHYYTKSAEEWRWKAVRGRGGKPASLPDRKHWYPDFADRDRNEATETDIVRHLPALRDLMASTRPGVSPLRPDEVQEDGARDAAAGEGARRKKRGRKKAKSDRRQQPPTEEEARQLAVDAVPALEALGWLASRKAKRPVDRKMRPVPWYTYGAIDLVAERVRGDMHVFEFGSGFSTLWWAQRAESVVAVEHDEGWAQQMAAKEPENAQILPVELDYDGEYCRTAVRCGDGPFHVIVVDGRDRVNCAINCLPALRDDGVIVWDDTQRDKYAPGIEHLLAEGFRRLRFRGLAPRLARLRETSVFYRSDNCFGL